MPIPGSRRWTVETIASGQPRAYADTICHVRVTFEWVQYWDNPDKKWMPNDLPEEKVRSLLKGFQCGFTEFDYNSSPKSIDDYFRTRLDWLKRVGDGVWEFHTTSAYTD
jgi:hypothetical protein